MDAQQALSEAIRLCGTAAELARRVGVSGQAINQWLRVPATRVLAVEAATDSRITRHQLRPDLYPEDGYGAGRVGEPRDSLAANPGVADSQEAA